MVFVKENISAAVTSGVCAGIHSVVSGRELHFWVDVGDGIINKFAGGRTCNLTEKMKVIHV